MVMGFLVDYKISDPSNTVFSENSSGTVVHDNLDWADLTQVNYFALLPNASPAYNGDASKARTATSDGDLQALSDSGYNPAVQLPGLVADAHSHNVKVYVTIGAGDANAIYDFDGVVNTPSVFSTFATNVKSFVDQYHLDGVDLDYEPTGAPGFTVTKTQLTNFGTLIKTFKDAYPTLPLTADPLGEPVEISSSSGVDSGTSALMLDAVAVQNLDEINVQAYSVQSKAQSDAILQNWADYVSGGKDFNNVTVNASVSKLQYGIDIAPDDTSNNPPGVIEAKVDTTISKGYGGLFVFELDADTGNPSVIKRIGDEIDADTGTPQSGGSVSGTVTQSNGAGITGVTVYLDANDNKALDTGEQSSTTHDGGAYSFTAVPAGAYIVRQILPAYTAQQSPANGSGNHVTVTNGSNQTGQNFIDNFGGAGGSVSGSVKDTHGAGIANVTVYLDANNNKSLDMGERSTITGGGGAYSFSNVVAGGYIVRQVLPGGLVQKTPTHGSGNHITVKNNSAVTKKNFVDMSAFASVGGKVRRPNKAGISGITTYLDANDNHMLDTDERRTASTESGYYTLADVVPGTYIVRQDLPADLVQTSPSNNSGNHITVVAGDSLTGKNFTDDDA